MKSKLLSALLLVITTACASVISSTAQAELTLTSSLFEDGGTLPAGSKCTRDGGDGLSPPIAWTGAPTETKSYAVIMHHYPRDKVEGVDTPSYYWLVWDIPADTAHFSKGNVESIGYKGGDKDKRYVGYTPPCSLGNASHAYIITVFALNSETSGLVSQDDIDVDWATMTKSIEDKVLEKSSITFMN